MLHYLLKMINKIKFVIIVIVLVALAGLFCQDRQLSHYSIDLMKHYMSLGEYDLALGVAESDPLVDNPDSLAWLMGNIYKFQNQPEEALTSFISAIELSGNAFLQEKAFDEVEKIIDLSPSRDNIELLISLLNYTSEDIYNTIIIKLAAIYEKNNLYVEANDIYFNLLESDCFGDTLGLRLKMATNSIRQENYHDAVKYAKQAQTESDSLFIPQALFLEFMGYYAQYDMDNSLEPLLRLYLEYPDFSRRFEIYVSLAELLKYREEYLAAWYILEEYYLEAGYQERQIIEEEIDIISRLLMDSKTIGKRFHLLKPDLGKLLHP